MRYNIAMNTDPIFFQALQKSGLNLNEANLYLHLLNHGESGIQQLVTDTGLKASNLYHILYALRDFGLIEQTDIKGKLHFKLKDPSSIRPLLEQKRQTTLDSIRDVEGILPELITAYTLTYHKPGISIFEGQEAITNILEDSLTARHEILQITDSESFDQYFSEEDARYVKKRLRKGLHKRMLIPDSPANQKYVASQTTTYLKYTTIQLLGKEIPRFKTSQLIYNNTISFQTLQPDSMIGVIIEDPLISLMQRQLFELLWKHSFGPN